MIKRFPPDVEALRSYDTPTLANGLDGLTDRPTNSGYTRPPIHAITPGMPPMLGRAVTATIRSESVWPTREERDESMIGLFNLLASSQEPTVLVVQDLDGPEGSGCLWGEVNCSIALALGCEGVVTDGLVRDIPEVSATGFGYIARGVGISHAYVRVEAVGDVVEVAGATVRPGELIHADRHGALVIPEEAIDRLVDSSESVIAREQKLIGWARSQEFDPRELRQRRLDH
ncbi:RraA family protein [Aeromicrobium panaciterrae]|uniref:RraA family protein n=1 Tax=Aeromicrobium panaciterrae TaxID=363861 RepID=UPI0031D4F441